MQASATATKNTSVLGSEREQPGWIGQMMVMGKGWKCCKQLKEVTNQEDAYALCSLSTKREFMVW